jgi:type IX secretion system PorP/SprF family membrane protein
MRKKLLFFACSCIGLVSFAQQDAQFSMNMFNRLSINPAYAGTNAAFGKNKVLCGTLLYRQQWSGFSGAPKIGLLSVDYGTVLHGGIGLTVDQDQLGFDKTLRAKLAYSYQAHIGAKGVLGIGLDVGMMQKSFEGTFKAPDGTTSDNPGTDPTIPWAGSSGKTYDLGFGLYYTTKKLYIGLSSLHLPEQTVKEQGGSGRNDFEVKRHYYVMAGYTFNLSNQLDLTPSLLTKSDATSTQLDINLMAKYNKIIFVGVSYRLTDAAVGIVGIEYHNFKVGYSYDYTLSAVKKYSSGSHEIMLGYCYKFPIHEYKQSHVNVRFL